MAQFDDLNLNSESLKSVKAPSQFQNIFEKMIGDMRFVGKFTIFYGVLTCLTIIGAIIGVPSIMIGLSIKDAADQFSIYKLTNNSVALKQGFEMQGKYFRLIKILIIIGLVILVINIILVVFLLTVGLSSLIGGSKFNPS